MNTKAPISVVLTTLLLGLVCGGCLDLKPVADPVRYFVLKPMEMPEKTLQRPTNHLAVGLAPIVLPTYLASPWMVVRTSETEIRYSDFNKWAEYPDKGIQRVLAQNLALILGTDLIRFDAWRNDSVDFSIHLTILRFEVDADGRATLDAQWQIEGSGKRTGHEVIHLDGPDPDTDPAGSVQTLSVVLAELSHKIAKEIHE